MTGENDFIQKAVNIGMDLLRNYTKGNIARIEYETKRDHKQIVYKGIKITLRNNNIRVVLDVPAIVFEKEEPCQKSPK